MGLREKVLKGALAVAVGQGGDQAMRLLRNLIVARLVSPEDFGIAATFVAVVSILDLISDLAVGKFIIQASDGEASGLQESLQTLMVIRGVLLGGIVYISADLVAGFFGMPENAWAYRCLAIAPIVSGFSHMDVYRIQRRFQFKDQAIVTILSAFVGLVSGVVLAVWLRNFEAILWSYLLQFFGRTLATHIIAKRPFRLGYSTSIFYRVFVFGWPLIVNGAVLALASMGDRVMIGATLGMTNLGVYAAAALIPFALNSFISKIIVDIYVPVLSDTQGNWELLRERYKTLFSFVALIAVVTVMPLVTMGNLVTLVAFGAKYQGPSTLVSWLALGTIARLLWSAPISAAISIGNTQSLVNSNVFKVIGVLAASVMLWMGEGLVAVAAAIALGDIAATIFAAIKINRMLGMPAHSCSSMVLSITAACLAIISYLHFSGGFSSVLASLSASMAFIMLMVAYLAAVSPNLRKYALSLLSTTFNNAAR